MKKLLAVFLTGCFLTTAVAQEVDTKSLTSNVVVTGIVKLDPKYKKRIEQANTKAAHFKVFNRDGHSLASDSAIVNDKIMFENVKYTFNEKTFKITTRTKHEEKEFNGGANVGGAFLILTKVEKGKVHLLYCHSAFSDPISFTKRLKKRTRYSLQRPAKK